MQIDIGIKIDGKSQSKGLMGVSLDEIQSKPTIIVKKAKKKKKKKSPLMKAVESAIPKKSEYTTEAV
jgi:hypothetical protein